MAVEPKSYRILTRLKAALIALNPTRYVSNDILLEFPTINPSSLPKKGQFYIWSEGIKLSDRFEITDQEEKFQVYELKVFIYTVTSHTKDRESKLLTGENIISYLHDDFISLNMRDLTSATSDETWIVGKRFISAKPTGAYGTNVSDILVELSIEFENRGSLYTTS